MSNDLKLNVTRSKVGAAAQFLATTAAGAVAFSRTSDPSTGDFSDAEIIRSFGTVPDVDTLLAAPRGADASEETQTGK